MKGEDSESFIFAESPIAEQFVEKAFSEGTELGKAFSEYFDALLERVRGSMALLCGFFVRDRPSEEFVARDLLDIGSVDDELVEGVGLLPTLKSRRGNACSSPRRLYACGRPATLAHVKSGRNEVYVQAYPELGAKTLISTDGGTEPVWSTDGTELFYRNRDDVLAVRVDSPSPGKPEMLFRRAFRVGSDDLGERQYDVSPDGRHFVMVQRGRSNQFNVVLNFLDELEEKIQAR